MDSVPAEWFKYRLRDSSGTWNKGENERFTPSNICDFILYDCKYLYLLELKSHQGKSIPKKAIRSSQVDGLYAQIHKEKVRPAVIFNFRDLAETYIVPIQCVHEFYYNENRKSFAVEWCREWGYRIPQEIKRTRYRYQISKISEFGIKEM